jgi:hypothetical protein
MHLFPVQPKRHINSRRILVEAAMTTRRTWWAVPALVVLLVAGVPRDALAFWGIFERLSGPGPFWGYQFSFDRLFCVMKSGPDGQAGWTHIEGRGADADAIACMSDTDRVRAFVSVEFTDVKSGETDQFPHAVAWRGLRPIIFYRLHESLDAGVGVGLNRFSGTGFGFSRFSVPIRLRVYAPGLKSGSRWRAINLAVQADFLPQKFTTTDFLAPPGPDMGNEVVPSLFLNVDVLRLFTGR